ncbi:class I SAM-dependent methyltransferase [Nocardioides sp. TF02-7]|uniref:class I SAM-dependent methyltransferase n=1 Tax=Nocardioides sp. TF02-7 TaxID=2917724 RepID=UPI001F06BAB9|nr:class I SAM-dependent methyltransferase [Nocardioides sp. TF02-7]UMG93542.1 class I SAM-dependent methyltransferase [Nocardioides sp. TF02-7]
MAFFDVAADAYVAFMGRFSTLLSGPFADLGLAGVDRSARVLDVGCGPGVLTGELVGRRGAGLVSAVDPADAFVEAAAAAYPDADVRTASAEALPYDDGVFGAALAQLVVHFMKEPVAGLAEMARVTAPGGRVSACVWDHAGGRSPVSAFWRIVTEHDPDARDQGRLPGTVEGELGRFLTAAGLLEVEGDDARGAALVRHLRGVVAAVHLRRGAGRRLRRGAQQDLPRRPGGRAAGGGRAGADRRRGRRLGGHRDRLRRGQSAGGLPWSLRAMAGRRRRLYFSGMANDQGTGPEVPDRWRVYDEPEGAPRPEPGDDPGPVAAATWLPDDPRPAPPAAATPSGGRR